MSDPARYRNDRVVEQDGANPIDGIVRWSPVKSLWLAAMAVGWSIGGSLYFSSAAVAVFLASSAATLCLGHSLGMHRKLIHESYECPDWLEKTGVWFGTLVGLGGPFTMMYTHDVRDWAQRQPDCHPFFSHQSGWMRDAWWQLNCKIDLDRPPGFDFPDRIANDRFYRVLQATSMAQQLPVAILLYAVGGIGFVAWGICGRVVVSILGHWLIGYFAHNNGHRDWTVEGAAVQGHNVRFCGWITFGECWHNNHHAFPASARIGLETGQSDPGWWVLSALSTVGLVKNPALPPDLPARPELQRVDL